MVKAKITPDMIEEPSLEFNEGFTGFDDITAACDACGDAHVGVGTPVVMVLPGMIYPSQEYDVPVFIPDTDVKLRVIELPNGMLGFVTDEDKTKYLHEDCYTRLIDTVACDMADLEDDEDDEEDEEEEDYE